MPNLWLVKTEPSTYSFSDLEREGNAVWDGVTNALALKHLRAMKAGDRLFVYHTGDEKCIVGVAEVLTDPYRDPKQDSDRLVVVKIGPRERLRRAVTLADVKAQKELAQWELARIARLSVMPVSGEQWKMVTAMSGGAAIS